MQKHSKWFLKGSTWLVNLALLAHFIILLAILVQFYHYQSLFHIQHQTVAEELEGATQKSLHTQMDFVSGKSVHRVFYYGSPSNDQKQASTIIDELLLQTDVGKMELVNNERIGQLIFLASIPHDKEQEVGTTELENSQILLPQHDLIAPFPKSEYLSLGIWLFADSLVRLIWSFTIFWLMRSFVLSLKKGHPFTHANTRLLLTSGIMVAVFPLLNWLTRQWEWSWLSSRFLFPDFEANPSIGFQTGLFFTGLVLLLVAGVFREGVKMREENELTI